LGGKEVFLKAEVFEPETRILSVQADEMQLLENQEPPIWFQQK
jgi:hypothetical protein